MSYGYDAGTNGQDRRTSMADPSGSASWTYDLRGRLTQEHKVIAGTGGGTFVTGWTYDALNRVATMTYPGTGGEVVTTTYALQGLPATLTNNSGHVYVDEASYTALGQPALVKFGGASLDLQTQYDYDSTNHRLHQLRVGAETNPGRDLDLTYTYDDAGNVTQIVDVRGGQIQNQLFGYDALDRLTGAYTSGPGAWGPTTRPIPTTPSAI